MKEFQKFLNNKGFNLKEDGVVGQKTMQAAYDYVVRERIKLKYPIDKTMITGIRTDQTLTNTFDDFMIVIKNGKIIICNATTTAGNYYIYNPLTVGGITGTAILKPGYYKNSHTFRTAANWSTLWLGMPYFEQTNNMTIYRDTIKNTVIDKTIETTGLYGINLHHMGIGNIINNWSAGCQGTPKNQWEEVIKLFENKEVISYCLIQA